MRIIFMGTPDIARITLEAVYNHPDAEIAAVVTQPDRAKGRGMKMIPPPVKEFALEHDIPVYQPKTLRDGAFQEVLDALQPGASVSALHLLNLLEEEDEEPPLSLLLILSSVLLPAMPSAERPFSFWKL